MGDFAPSGNRKTWGWCTSSQGLSGITYVSGETKLFLDTP